MAQTSATGFFLNVFLSKKTHQILTTALGGSQPILINSENPALFTSLVADGLKRDDDRRMHDWVERDC